MEALGRRGVALLAAALVLGGGSPALAQAPVMKIGNATINDVQHEWQKRFAERVNAKAAGRLRVEVYPASQLAPQPQMIEGVQLGTIEAMILPPQFLVGIDPRFQALAAPGLVRDWHHAHRLARDPEVREMIFTLGANRGVIGISLIVYGPTAIVARPQVTQLSDLRGLRIRSAPSPMAVEPLRRLGAAPVPMPLGEAIAGMRTGAIDGAYGAVSVFNAYKLQDTARHILLTQWDFVFAGAFVSRAWFDRLPADLRQLIRDEAAAIEPELFEWVMAAQDQATREWTANGGIITELSEAERASLAAMMEQVGSEVASTNPRLLEGYRAVRARAEALR